MLTNTLISWRTSQMKNKTCWLKPSTHNTTVTLGTILHQEIANYVVRKIGTLVIPSLVMLLCQQRGIVPCADGIFADQEGTTTEKQVITAEEEVVAEEEEEVSENEKEKEEEDSIEKIITAPEFVGANIDNLE
ncbi:hypothetical protein PVK06_020351 [Gossypium arboreum]|uniref:Uncharacterized protein n=1 Tax=Gossypium arboreum TaxID=29729 RepID=A0ABR0PMG2_GOSAR|nr:hypothetical protein PVK06_020351 [Gossypium arboreum]